MRDLFAAIGVLVILSTVMLVTKLFANRLSGEGSRKIIHITMGCIALSLPYVFIHRLSVLYLGVAAIAMLLLLRLNKNLRNGIGTALLGISRKSFGEIYFVISIVFVYMLHKSTFEYLIPILVLTFADSTAALIGTSYGRYNMAHSREDSKSREGSAMFFIVAFICTLVPLQLMTEIGRAEVLVISFLIGMLAAMIEAVSANGNDNLLLPLLTYSFIRYNTDQSLMQMFTNFGTMLFFLVATLLVYKITNITKLSIAYSLLVGYVVMILGGPYWVMPPLMLLLMFGIMPMMKDEERQMIQTYKVIESNTLVGVLCLYFSVFFPQYRDILYVAFSFTFACLLAINTYSRFVNFFNAGMRFAVACGLAKAVVFIVLPTLLLTRVHWLSIVIYLVFLAAAIPPAVYLNKKYDYKNVGDETFRANMILTGALAVALSVSLLAAGVMNGIS
ncbi:MAG: hypothetical protein FWH01_07870 [Oscillospiraceae bacterium]|nr:hypothetical protein [Oscillospiraceae bacterium]